MNAMNVPVKNAVNAPVTVNKVASIKGRLKNKSVEIGRTMQEMFTAYGLERTIYRLSISRYAENFTLKGGIFLYAIFDGNYARATTDIDFLAQKTSNAIDDMKQVFTEILSLEANDPLRFDHDSLISMKYARSSSSVFRMVSREPRSMMLFCPL